MSAQTWVLAALALGGGCVTQPEEPAAPPVPSLPALPLLPDGAACQPLDADGAPLLDLLATGCVDTAGWPEEAAIPYAVRAPLWSEGADKARAIALPALGVMEHRDDGPLALPDGATLIKSFALPLQGADGDVVVETRLMAAMDGGFRFATYRWDDGAPERVPDDGAERELTLRDGSALLWTYPSSVGCLSCHDGLALGPRPPQLDLRVRYGDEEADQLDALVALGALDARPPEEGHRPIARPDDLGAPLLDRARGWLEANCAHCHRPGGWTPEEMDMDLRWSTPIGAARICDVPVQFDTAPALGGYRLRPGAPEDSALLQRALVRGPLRMPPAGGERDDPQADGTLGALIRSLDGCPE